MLQIPLQKLKDILTQEGISTPEKIDEATAEAGRLGQSVSATLISKGIISQSYYNNLLSNFFSVPFADLEARKIDMDVFNMVPEPMARQRKAIAFGREPDGSIAVAFEDPNDLITIDFFEKYLKAKIKPFLATDSDLNKGFSIYGKAIGEDYRKIIERNIMSSIENKATGEDAATELPIVEMINNIISYAISLRASDIHIEIFEDTILVRYRIDGILHEIFKAPKDVYPAILARVKLLGAMKIDEHYKPQDGRIRYTIANEAIDVRISIIPTFYGEKIEMRLLTSSNRPLSFSELGVLPDMAKALESNARKSYGMILVTGPTGSGKSTTLYSILNILNRPEVNIVTIEDPIEYDIKYVNQTQVNHSIGTTFATGLRAILRQDPNIIMVGEIRDDETADISVQAALTGHLVLSSLHTNDAPTAIPRLFDMKLPPFLVSATLIAALAQRLVRRICRDCISSEPLSADLVAVLEEQAKLSGVSVGFTIPKLVFRGKGCNVCGHTGYRGRIGIFELLDVTENIRKYIISPDFTLDGLVKLSRSNGMIGMFEDGIKKAELGVTTIEELLRVIRE